MKPNLDLFFADKVRYEIVRPIAEGGMGFIYEARQVGVHGFEKRVALKVVKSEYAKHKNFVDNFIGEAKLVADLIHANIVQTYHLGKSDDNLFMVMELVNGWNLFQISLKHYYANLRLPLELAVFIASRICRALAYAHAKTSPEGEHLGLVHRDISPSNIMIAYEGDVKLSDFGIAKAKNFLRFREGEEMVGKCDYMSPEQASWKETDCRSDLFSVGIVLAELLLGYNLFQDQDSEKALTKIKTLEIPDFTKLDPRITPGVNTILQTALQRDLSARYQNATDMLTELEYEIYKDGYGPTSETLANYMKTYFPETDRVVKKKK